MKVKVKLVELRWRRWDHHIELFWTAHEFLLSLFYSSIALNFRFWYSFFSTSKTSSSIALLRFVSLTRVFNYACRSNDLLQLKSYRFSSHLVGADVILDFKEIGKWEIHEMMILGHQSKKPGGLQILGFHLIVLQIFFGPLVRFLSPSQTASIPWSR